MISITKAKLKKEANVKIFSINLGIAESHPVAKLEIMLIVLSIAKISLE